MVNSLSVSLVVTVVDAAAVVVSGAVAKVGVSVGFSTEVLSLDWGVTMEVDFFNSTCGDL